MSRSRCCAVCGSPTALQRKTCGDPVCLREQQRKGGLARHGLIAAPASAAADPPAVELAKTLRDAGAVVATLAEPAGVFAVIGSRGLVAQLVTPGRGLDDAQAALAFAWDRAGWETRTVTLGDQDAIAELVDLVRLWRQAHRVRVADEAHDELGRRLPWALPA